MPPDILQLLVTINFDFNYFSSSIEEAAEHFAIKSLKIQHSQSFEDSFGVTGP